MYRVIIEVPPSPTAVLGREIAEHLEQALAARITEPGTVSVAVTDAGACTIVGAFGGIDGLAHHRAVANDILSAVTALGLYGVRVVATRSATWAVEGLASGLVTGLGASTKQKAELRPWILIISGIVGSAVGKAIEKQIQLFEWQRNEAGYWCETQPGLVQPEWGWQA